MKMALAACFLGGLSLLSGGCSGCEEEKLEYTPAKSEDRAVLSVNYDQTQKRFDTPEATYTEFVASQNRGDMDSTISSLDPSVIVRASFSYFDTFICFGDPDDPPRRSLDPHLCIEAAKRVLLGERELYLLDAIESEGHIIHLEKVREIDKEDVDNRIKKARKYLNLIDFLQTEKTKTMDSNPTTRFYYPSPETLSIGMHAIRELEGSEISDELIDLYIALSNMKESELSPEMRQRSNNVSNAEGNELRGIENLVVRYSLFEGDQGRGSFEKQLNNLSYITQHAKVIRKKASEFKTQGKVSSCVFSSKSHVPPEKASEKIGPETKQILDNLNVKSISEGTYLEVDLELENGDHSCKKGFLVRRGDRWFLADNE